MVIGSFLPIAIKQDLSTRPSWKTSVLEPWLTLFATTLTSLRLGAMSFWSIRPNVVALKPMSWTWISLQDDCIFLCVGLHQKNNKLGIQNTLYSPHLIFRYSLGAVFLNDDCEECECRAGGTVHCTPRSPCPKCTNVSRKLVVEYGTLKTQILDSLTSMESYPSTLVSACASPVNLAWSSVLVMVNAFLSIYGKLFKTIALFIRHVILNFGWIRCNGVSDCTDDEVRCQEPTPGLCFIKWPLYNCL